MLSMSYLNKNVTVYIRTVCTTLIDDEGERFLNELNISINSWKAEFKAHKSWYYDILNHKKMPILDTRQISHISNTRKIQDN